LLPDIEVTYVTRSHSGVVREASLTASGPGARPRPFRELPISTMEFFHHGVQRDVQIGRGNGLVGLPSAIRIQHFELRAASGVRDDRSPASRQAVIDRVGRT